MVAGIIMRDVKTGLVVGQPAINGSGVGTYGGANMPDFMTGAIIGTAYAVISGKVLILQSGWLFQWVYSWCS